MSQELDDILKHWGVKGMKWGVRKDRKTSGQNGSNAKNYIKSKKKEIGLVKTARVKEMDKLSTDEIRAQANRLRMENQLKKYSSIRSVGTRRDRKDYLRRSEMSDEELQRKVGRLRIKAEYKRQVKEANSEQIALGKQIATYAAPAVLGYAVAKSPDIARQVKKYNTPQNRKIVAEMAKAIIK